ncbi:MAG: hypothetical protein EOP88_27605 [Verrucomicrobiaceae bacterium]|nr:MAG: hypothetical protein EOP88_27605 [Verrucomicrobiaceae bacterium]
MSRNSKVIVIVCVSVVLLAGLGGGVIFFGKVGVKVRKQAKLTVTKAQVQSMETALKGYHTDHAAYPTGTGDEILETLQGASTRGENPMRIRYLDLPTTGRSGGSIITPHPHSTSSRDGGRRRVLPRMKCHGWLPG